MKTIGITGGTGFVGTHLTALLLAHNYEVIIFTRNVPIGSPSPNIVYARWDPDKEVCDADALRRLDAIAHLAGAGIADKRWTARRKEEIVHSRAHATDFLVRQLKRYALNCKTFVAASAIGFYGPDREKNAPFTETSPPYNDFLGDTCSRWETASRHAAEMMRTVILRFGIVLGKEGGAYPKLAGPLSFGVMPILGSGRQVVSWIEVGDLARLILFALEREEVSGIYNAVAPNPVSHLQMMKAIAQAKGGIKIPAPAPSFLLKLILGEMAGEVLKSSNVSAQKIIDSGFTFKSLLSEKIIEKKVV